MRRAIPIGAGLVAAALVAWVLVPSSHDPRPATPSPRSMTAVPLGYQGDGILRVVPPIRSRCQGSDIAVRAIPQVPGRNGSTEPALASVQSRRTCQLQQRGQVTPLRSDGRPAAPAVILPLPDQGQPVTVSPGHAAKLEINWFSGTPCPVTPATSRADRATSFSYDIAGAEGRFQLLQPVVACPMEAYLQSEDAVDLARNNDSNHEPLTQVTVTAPAAVTAGVRFIAHAILYYDSTTSAVFDPCPVFWTQLSPQSAPATTRSWTLECTGMAPLELGDVVNFDVPLMAPADLAPQTVDLDIGFGMLPPNTAVTSSAPHASTQLTVRGSAQHMALQPVAWAPLPPPPTPTPLQRVVSPPCGPGDISPGDLAPHYLVPGGGVHSDYFTLTNISHTPCTLYKNAPVLLAGPSLISARIPSGAASLFAGTVDGELEPGGITQVQFEFLNHCDPADETAAKQYRTVVIDLPAGPLVVPRPIDASCGVGTGGAGVNADPAKPGPRGASPLYESGAPTDPERDGTVDLRVPSTLPRGLPTIIEVTLRGQANWTSGCPGYVITIAQVETRHGLACTITHVLEDVPATYQIQVEPPMTAALGSTTIRFELLCGLIPTTSQPVTIVSSG